MPMLGRTPICVALFLPMLAGMTCGGKPAEPIVGTAEIRVLHYDYHFDMETREAKTTLTIAIEAPGNCFSLPMRSEGLRDTSIDGEVLLSESHNGTIAEFCGEGWPASTEIALSTSTTVPMATWENSQVGYSSRQDIEGELFTYMVSWVGGCDRFGPCDSSPDAFAKFTLTVDHPADQLVLCPGQLTLSDTQTQCDFSFEGGPTYSSFGFAASPSWTRVDMGDWGGIAVSFYDMPSANLAAQVSVEEHKDFSAWMVQHFGPYPYGNELRFAVGPTFWNGFEHPGNIVLNERLNTGSLGSAYSNPLAHTISHEIAHQWAGDQTTLSSTYDFVWKEAMAEYLVYVHKEEEISESRARRTLTAWKSFSRSSEFYLVPAEKPPLIEYYGDVYGPGPMILFRQLEAIYDRASVLQALETLLGSPRAIGVSEVQKALEDATSADLTNYFESWVYGQGVPAWPQFSVTTENTQDGVVVVVTQLEADKDLFGCAFTISLQGAEKGQEQDLRVNLGADGMAVWTDTVDPGFVVNGFRFDTENECLGTLAGAQSNQDTGPKRNPMVAPSYSQR